MGKIKQFLGIEKKDILIQDDILEALKVFDTYNENKDYYTEINIIKALLYYETVAPLGDAVDMIANKFASIQLSLKNQKTNEYETEHPLLSLLKKPNADITGYEFKRNMAIYYLVTGNCYIRATGMFNRPPLELYCKKPQFISITENYSDGFAGSYRYNVNSQSEEYKRNEQPSGFRYYDNNGLGELWHIKGFNAGSNLFGKTNLTKMFYELEQYINGNIHNLALLKNGARLAGLLLVSGLLTKEQFDALKEQFKEQYTGTKNAGKSLLAQSGSKDSKIDYKELGQNNKDMDYGNQKKDVKLMIYKMLNIPLPLVSPDHMTLGNYSEANTALYDDAVLPLADYILLEMGNFLLPRYPDGDKYELTYNPITIPALQKRANEDVKFKKDSGVLTYNEIRALLGYTPIDGGDEVFKPNNLVPLGYVQEPLTMEKPIKTPKEKFIEILTKNRIDSKRIKELTEKHYG